MDRVVCIESIISIYNPRPQVGEIYTVENVYNDGLRDYYWLSEFQYSMHNGRRVDWWVGRFRPVDYEFGEETTAKIEKELVEKQEPILI